MDISKEDFVRLTTEGYPISLRHPRDDFYSMFAEFVNSSKENEFFAEVDSGILMHAGMRTEICKIVYREGRVIILSKINNDSEESSVGEFDSTEEYQILGLACLGVLYFCDLYAAATGQNAQTFPEDEISNVNNNGKYNIWPM